jgi:hypothetical protein
MAGVPQILAALKQFIDGPDRGMARAGELEVMLDSAFPDDEEMQDLVLALASYRPEGGEYLYDEATIVKMCKYSYSVLERRL